MYYSRKIDGNVSREGKNGVYGMHKYRSASISGWARACI
jgi:hypothetical protein